MQDGEQRAKVVFEKVQRMMNKYKMLKVVNTTLNEKGIKEDIEMLQVVQIMRIPKASQDLDRKIGEEVVEEDTIEGEIIQVALAIVVKIVVEVGVTHLPTVNIIIIEDITREVGVEVAKKELFNQG